MRRRIKPARHHEEGSIQVRLPPAPLAQKVSSAAAG
jgi:hypothetical protein